MPSTADLFIKVAADMGAATRQFTALQGTISTFGATGGQAGSRFAAGFSGQIAGGLATASKALAGLSVGGVLAVGAGLGVAAKSGFGFNNSMEQVTARLNAFTKDGKQSAKILEMIRTRAAKTPFAFEEMANATASLMSSAKTTRKPLESLVETAEILAASNPAQGLEGAAVAIREAVGGDFVSLIERFDIPRQMINKFKEEGVPNIEIVSRALQEMGYDADLVANMAQTMTGRWSTFKDSLLSVAATATAPMFEKMSAGLGRLQEKIDANMPAIEAFAATLGTKLGSAFDWVVDTAIPRFVTAWEDLGPKVGLALDILRDTLAGFSTGDFSNLEVDLSSVFGAEGADAITANLQRVREGFGLARDAIGVLGDKGQEVFDWFVATGLPEFNAAFEESLPRNRQLIEDLFAAVRSEMASSNVAAEASAVSLEEWGTRASTALYTVQDAALGLGADINTVFNEKIRPNIEDMLTYVDPTFADVSRVVSDLAADFEHAFGRIGDAIGRIKSLVTGTPLPMPTFDAPGGAAPGTVPSGGGGRSFTPPPNMALNVNIVQQPDGTFAATTEGEAGIGALKLALRQVAAR